MLYLLSSNTLRLIINFERSTNSSWSVLPQPFMLWHFLMRLFVSWDSLPVSCTSNVHRALRNETRQIIIHCVNTKTVFFDKFWVPVLKRDWIPVLSFSMLAPWLASYVSASVFPCSSLGFFDVYPHLSTEQRGRRTERQTDEESDRRTYKETHIQTDRWTDRHSDEETDEQRTDRWTDGWTLHPNHDSLRGYAEFFCWPCHIRVAVCQTITPLSGQASGRSLYPTQVKRQ